MAPTHRERILQTLEILLPTLPGSGMIHDNIGLIADQFGVKVGTDFAGGWGFFCLKCGSYARAQENWFECLHGWLPVIISCDHYPFACKNKWRLYVGPNGNCC